MDDLQMWALLVGALTPPVLALVQQPTWSRPLRTAVTVVACIVIGGGTAWFSGGLTGRRWTTAALIVLVAALTTYRNVWRPAGIGTLEAATSPQPAAQPALAAQPGFRAPEPPAADVAPLSTTYDDEPPIEPPIEQPIEQPIEEPPLKPTTPPVD